MSVGLSSETVSGEALFILKTLKENGRLGRSNKLGEVKRSLEDSVSLDFDSYFFFLRKFHYIAMDREAQLRLTEQGEQVVQGEGGARLEDEVDTFFADQLQDPEITGEQPVGDFFPPLIPKAPMPDENDFPPPPPRLPRRPLPGEDRGDAVPVREAFLPPPPPPNLGLGAAAGKGTDLDLRYMKFDALGTGPLGTVFKGRHNALGTDVCIKELKDLFGYFSFLQRSEVVKRLKRELGAQAQVRHPGVVALLDQNADVARPYYVMELCRGSLREKLDQAGEGKGLEVALAIRYFLQLCYGFRACHAAGLTHHNLKPENVLFDGYGNAKLGDFGLSRVIEVDASKGMPQVIVGTGGMAYMAPELISRSRDGGNASDVYGLGILFYEMLTGQLPGRRSPLPSEVNPEVPAKLDVLFDKMTQDRRDARYPDFEAVLADFYAAFDQGEFLGSGDLLMWSGSVEG